MQGVYGRLFTVNYLIFFNINCVDDSYQSTFIRTCIDGQHLRDDEHSVGVRLHAEPFPGLDVVHGLLQRDVNSHLEGAGPGHDAAVVQRVLDGSEAVVNRVLENKTKLFI